MTAEQRLVTTDGRGRVTLPGRPNQRFAVREFEDGRILLEPASGVEESGAKGTPSQDPGRMQVLSKDPKFRGLKGRKVTPRQSILAARIVVESDARNGRETEQKFIDLARQRIFAPNGEELVFEWPQDSKARGTTEPDDRDNPAPVGPSRETM